MKDAYFNMYLLKIIIIIDIKKYKMNLFWIIKESNEQISVTKSFKREKRKLPYLSEGKRLILIRDNTQRSNSDNKN